MSGYPGRRYNDELSDEDREFFEAKVRPLLVAHCFECHGPEVDGPDGGLSLATRATMLAGGDTGPAIEPGDNFVLAGLESAGLKPASDASRRTLIRRLSFDLTGMPPTSTGIDDFLADDSGAAVERVVDRLIVSPRFGEHRARHWMDLVRYAETGGHEFDYPIPDAWRYRDYLIRAFNADVPYNDLIREHIAGDLIQQPRLSEGTEAGEFNESIPGTGFRFLGEDFHAPVDVRADQVMHFDNQIDVMTKTFLGLTVACARAMTTNSTRFRPATPMRWRVI